MNPTESVRLNKSEIDTIVTGCAYNLTSRAISYNKSRVLSQCLGKSPMESKAVAVADENAEQSSKDSRNATSRQKLTDALNQCHTRCTEDIADFQKMLAIGVGIQSRLLAAVKTPTGVANVTFNAEECEFINESLRTFEVAEIEPIMESEMILAAIIPPTRYDESYADAGVSQSSFRTQDQQKEFQTSRNAFICLQAKIITLGNNLATGGPAANNDQ